MNTMKSLKPAPDRQLEPCCILFVSSVRFYLATFIFAAILADCASVASALLPFDYHHNILKVEKSVQLLGCMDDPKNHRMDNETQFLTHLVSIFSRSWLESEQLKFHYIRDVMRAYPNTLEAGLEGWREAWIPEAPIPSISAFQSLESNALEFMAKNLSLYAVVLHQVHQDIITHEPSVEHRLKRIQNRNHLILCKIQAHSQIALDQKLVKKMLEQKIIEKSTKSERNRRVYLILRDYSRFLNFSLELLLYKISNVQNNKT